MGTSPGRGPGDRRRYDTRSPCGSCITGWSRQLIPNTSTAYKRLSARTARPAATALPRTDRPHPLDSLPRVLGVTRRSDPRSRRDLPPGSHRRPGHVPVFGVEKSGIVNQLQRGSVTARPADLALGGYSSQSYAAGLSGTSSGATARVLLYAGDHDPSGHDICGTSPSAPAAGKRCGASR